MGKQATKIDKALSKALGTTKNPSHFCFAPGAEDHGLAISKKPIKSDVISKLRARSKGTKLIKGTCVKVKGTLVFSCETTPPELKKKALEETIFQLTNKRLTCAVNKSDTPYDESAEFPDEQEEQDEGVGYQVDLQDPNAPLSVDPREAQQQVVNRIKALSPNYSKLVAGLRSTEAGQLKVLMGQASLLVQEKKFAEALLLLNTLSDEIDRLLPTLPRQPEAPPKVDVPDEDDDLGTAFEQLFDEHKTEFERLMERIQPRYPMALERNKDLKELMDEALKFQKDEEFETGVPVLQELEKEIDKLDPNWNPYRLKRKAFNQTVKLAERMIQAKMPELIEAQEKARARGGDEVDIPVPDVIQKGRQIMLLKDQAELLAAQKNYTGGIAKLDEGEELARQARAKIEEMKREVDKDREKDAEKEKEVFAFSSRMTDKDWGFDTDDDAMTFMLGTIPDENGTLVKSPKLAKMEETLAACLKRRDKLVELGCDPVESANVAFGNIPKNFWPDSVVRECVMFKRAQEHFENLQEAEEDGKTLLGKVAGGFKTGGTVVGYSRSVFKKVQGQVGVKDQQTGETDQQKVTEAKELLTVGGWTPTTEQLEMMDDILKILTITAKPAGSLLQAVGSGLQAIDLEMQAREEDDNPVKVKMLEFQRNLALIEMASKLLDAGTSLAKGILPALAALGYGKKALEALARAVYYFEKLHQIAQIKDTAKLDRESMMLLPLAHEARNRKIQASKKLVEGIAMMMRAVGSALENVPDPSGGTQIAGVVLDVTGKCVKVGGKVVFKGIAWSDAQKAHNDLKKAVGPPPNRKAMTLIFKDHAKYAKFALCYGALEEKDPWAIQYLVTTGLTEDDLAHPNTSVQILREYLHVVTEEKEEMKTFKETIKWDKVKEGAGKAKGKLQDISDTVIGRDLDHELDPNWRAGHIDLSRENWQDTKVQAIRAGWYEDRGGMGDLLDEYGKAEFAYAEKVDDPDELDALNSVVVVLEEIQYKLGKMEPVAQDRTTPHPGMLDYVSRLKGRADLRHTELGSRRGDLKNLLVLQLPPNSTPQQIEAKKEEVLQQSLEKAQQKSIEDRGKRKLAIQGLWETTKFASPYGKCTVLGFGKLAAKKLRLDEELAEELDTECAQLHLSCLESLYESLAGVPEDDLEDEFKLQSKFVLERLSAGLRPLCATYYAEKIAQGGMDNSGEDDWEPTDFTLSAANWRAVKTEAAKHGYVDESTGIGEALDKFERFYQALQTSTTDVQTQRSAAGALLDVEDLLREFAPLNKVGLPHAALVLFRESLLGEVAKFKDQMHDIIDKATGSWKAPAADLDPESWSRVKAAAVEHAMKEHKTGIKEALQALKDAEQKFNANMTDSGLRKAYAEAIVEAEKKLTKFKPVNELKRPHVAMTTYRENMLKLLARARKGLDRDTTGNFQVSDFTLTRAAWRTNKASAAESGMKPGKSGVGKALDEYNTKLQAWQGKQTSRDKRLEFAEAAKELEKVLLAWRPQDDFGDPHMPMVNYRTKLIEAINEQRQAIMTTAVGAWAPADFALTGAAWRGVKAAAIEHGMKDEPTGLGDALDAVAEAKKEFDKKPKDRELKVAYIDALRAARLKLVPLSPVDDFAKPFTGMVQYRDQMIRNIDTEIQRLEAAEEKNWAPPPIVLSTEAWQNAKARAVEFGMVKVETGLKDAFTKLKTTETEYQASKGKDAEKRRLYVDAIDVVLDRLRKFGPIDDFGKKFQPMIEYRNGMIRALEQHRSELETANESKWQPTNFALTKAAWEQTKEAASQNGWYAVDDTGLTPALEAFEKAHAKWSKKPKDKKIRIKALDSLDKVKTALINFNPINDFKTTHKGMAYYRIALLDEVERRTGEIEGRVRRPWMPTNFAFTRDAWQEVKRDALADGWKESKSAVGGALEAYQKTFLVLQQKPHDDKTKKLMFKVCGEVAKKIGGLKAVKADNTAHPGMVLYKDTMLSRLASFEQKLGV